MTERADTDPRRIRALAVHTDDILTALEARKRERRQTVLRVLPPFSGRMRARIHVVAGTGRENGALHVHPGAFVANPPAYPGVDETEDELRARGEYDIETHREAHAKAVADWRETVRSRLRERLVLTFPRSGGENASSSQTTLSVSYLG
ncbi:MAG: hypothetical protein ABEH90_01305 [Halolamina sp.]